jgi:hypothetical protein
MDELHTLASKIGAEQSDDQITLIYNIIDKESEVGSMEVPAEVKPKKRGRKSKAEKEAENAIQQEQPLETAEVPAEVDTNPAEEAPQPKKRGRKPKTENEEVAPQEPKKRGRKPKTESLEDKPAQAEPVTDTPSENAEVGHPVAFKIVQDIRPTSLILAQLQTEGAYEEQKEQTAPELAPKVE